MNKDPITVEGFKSLQDELKQLIAEERPKIINAISEARAHGDLKENAEYHAAKEKQGVVEGRVLQLQGVIANALVIVPSEVKADKIVFGATVTLLDTEKDETVTYKIVGETESDMKQGKISYKSPVGKAIIGKEEGDTVIVRAPKGDVEYEVESFEYI